MNGETMPRVISSSASAAHLPSLRSLHNRVMGALGLVEQRRRLADMEDWQLRDLGLTRSDAHREATRPLWSAPHFSRS